MMSADSDLYYSKVSVMFAALLGVLCLLPATSSQNGKVTVNYKLECMYTMFGRFDKKGENQIVLDTF